MNFDALPPLQPGNTLRTEWSIAWAQLRSKRHRTLLSVTSILGVLAVTLGVAVLDCSTAVMVGFEEDLTQKLINGDAHVLIETVDTPFTDYEAVLTQVRADPRVRAAAPFVQGEVMLRSTYNTTGTIIRGIRPTEVVTNLEAELTDGLFGKLSTPELRAHTLHALAQPVPPTRPETMLEPTPLPGILIGHRMQDALTVRTGDVVQLINPVGHTVNFMGIPSPAMRSYRVLGIYKTAMVEFDGIRSYLNLEDAADFLELKQGVTGIEVSLNDLNNAPSFVRSFEDTLGPTYRIQDWQHLNASMYDALVLQRVVVSMLLSITVLIATLLIVSMLLMIVITKGREIAILKAIGASDPMIMRVFVLQGSAVAAVGVLLGTLLGMAAAYTLEWYGYPLDAEVYAMDVLPVVVRWQNIAQVAVGAFGGCVLATLIPARLAGRLDPIVGLRLAD